MGTTDLLVRELEAENKRLRAELVEALEVLVYERSHEMNNGWRRVAPNPIALRAAARLVALGLWERAVGRYDDCCLYRKKAARAAGEGA